MKMPATLVALTDQQQAAITAETDPRILALFALPVVTAAVGFVVSDVIAAMNRAPLDATAAQVLLDVLARGSAWLDILEAR